MLYHPQSRTTTVNILGNTVEYTLRENKMFYRTHFVPPPPHAHPLEMTRKVSPFILHCLRTVKKLDDTVPFIHDKSLDRVFLASKLSTKTKEIVEVNEDTYSDKELSQIMEDLSYDSRTLTWPLKIVLDRKIQPEEPEMSSITSNTVREEPVSPYLSAVRRQSVESIREEETPSLSIQRQNGNTSVREQLPDVTVQQSPVTIRSETPDSVVRSPLTIRKRSRSRLDQYTQTITKTATLGPRKAENSNLEVSSSTPIESESFLRFIDETALSDRRGPIIVNGRLVRSPSDIDVQQEGLEYQAPYIDFRLPRVTIVRDEASERGNTPRNTIVRNKTSARGNAPENNRQTKRTIPREVVRQESVPEPAQEEPIIRRSSRVLHKKKKRI